MKIAYLFFGYARTHGQLIDNYKRFLDCNADVFIQTYDTFYSRKGIDDIYSTDTVTYTSEEFFKQTFNNIKHCNTDPQDNNILNEIIRHNNLPLKNEINQETIRTLSFFLTINRLIEAKIRHEAHYNMKYDCCVLLRLDLLFNSPLVIPSNLNKLSYPQFHDFNGDHRSEGAARVFSTDRCLNDQIMICNSDICNAIKDIICKIPECHHKYNIMINNETLIGFHLLHHNIHFSPEDFVTYRIHRG